MGVSPGVLNSPPLIPWKMALIHLPYEDIRNEEADDCGTAARALGVGRQRTR
jgi:hypothetical protein